LAESRKFITFAGPIKGENNKMKELLLILLITIILITICIVLFSIKIILKKNGKFSHTCAFDWQECKCKDCNGSCEDCTINIGEIDIK